jgi:outer membrane protein W
MRKQLTTILLAGLCCLAGAATSYGADNGYVAIKGGVFFPNGEGSSGNENGFKDLGTGYNAELAVGYRPEPYVAFELGSGIYGTNGTVSEPTTSNKITATCVPVTLTVKGILTFERLELFAGAGGGYYFGTVEQKTTGGVVSIDQSSHGGALGYLVTAGGDFKLSKRLGLGAEFKWFSAQPELEFTDISSGSTVKQKWQIGGSLLNLGLKYSF